MYVFPRVCITIMQGIIISESGVVLPACQPDCLSLSVSLTVSVSVCVSLYVLLATFLIDDFRK